MLTRASAFCRSRTPAVRAESPRRGREETAHYNVQAIALATTRRMGGAHLRLLFGVEQRGRSSRSRPHVKASAGQHCVLPITFAEPAHRPADDKARTEPVKQVFAVKPQVISLASSVDRRNKVRS